MSRYSVSLDANQGEIVAALRQVGARVLLINGTIDALVWFRKGLYLVDFKSGPKAPRTKAQRALVAEGWPLVFWSSVDEALVAIGAIASSSENK
jgi:hypothetical protein